MARRDQRRLTRPLTWLVLAVAAVVLIGSCSRSETDGAPLEPTEPDAPEADEPIGSDQLPSIDDWRWQELTGNPASLPNNPPRARVDGELVVPDHESPDVWWRSPDGIVWKQGERPAELPPSVWLAQVGTEAWALSDGPPFRHTKEVG